MQYYAHTTSGRPEQDWEPLIHHLCEVAEGARTRGGRFGAEELAGLAGRLHDLGKDGPSFQARSHDPSKSADHSTAGAVWAVEHLRNAWGKLLAHVVAGHHAGLKDNLLGAEGRIAAKHALLAPVERAARGEGLTLPEAVAAPAGWRQVRNTLGFQLAFLTRMVFSCLIDADRSAAAAFGAGENQEEAAPHPSIETLGVVLQGWMEARSTKASPLNDLRNQVLRTVVAQAARPRGTFTLSVPTGGGKTLMSLAFALAHAQAHAQDHGLDRVVVVIPFTSIIEQTAQVYRDALAPFGDASGPVTASAPNG